MSNKKILQDIQSLFDIDVSPNEDTESNDYETRANDASQQRPFEELAAELGDSLDGLSDKVPAMGDSPKPSSVSEAKSESKIEVVNPIFEQPQTSAGIEQLDKKAPDPIAEMILDAVAVETAENYDDIFASTSSSEPEEKSSIIEEGKAEDPIVLVTETSKELTASLVEKSTSETQESQKDESPGKSEKSADKSLTLSDFGHQETLGPTPQQTVEYPVVMSKIPSNDQFDWKLSSTSEKYKNFYAEKSAALSYLLPGGLVPFDKYNSDLSNARVDLNIPFGDTELAWERMKEITNWRDRIQEIFIHVNRQFHLWKKFSELFQGILAKLEYEKPVIKQGGVVYDHMRDMERYYVELEACHSACLLVLKNLDAAFNTLSRQVSIVLDQREPERLTGSPSSVRRPKSDFVDYETRKEINNKSDDFERFKEFDGFDKLEDNATAIQQKQPTNGYCEF